jgi:hypothetical protein
MECWGIDDYAFRKCAYAAGILYDVPSALCLEPCAFSKSEMNLFSENQQKYLN